MIPVIADVALRSSVLLGAAWAAAAYAERSGASAATRHVIWLCGFTALAMLPVCLSLAPVIPIHVLPAEPMLTPGGAADVGNSAPGRASAGPSTVIILKAVYLIVAAVLLSRLLVGRILLERLWRYAEPLRRTRALTVADAACRGLGIRRPVEIRLLEGVVPMTWGTVRPRLLLPKDAESWTNERLRSVLLHECGHIARHDGLVRAAVETVSAFYWPHPAIWLAIRRLRLSQEQASDDLALTHGTPALDYARHLLASACCRSALPSGLAMAHSTDLRLRMEAILGEAERGRVSSRFLTLSTLLTLGLAAPVSAIVLAPMPGGAGLKAAASVAPEGNAESWPGATAVVSTVKSRAHWAAAGRSRARHSPEVGNPMPVNDLASETRALGQQADHQDRQARYSGEVQHYDAELKRYSVQLDSYSRSNAEFVRKTREYQERMAQIGPDPPAGTVLPTAPAAPAYPVAPTAPVERLQPPTLLRSH